MSVTNDEDKDPILTEKSTRLYAKAAPTDTEDPGSDYWEQRRFRENEENQKEINFNEEGFSSYLDTMYAPEGKSSVEHLDIGNKRRSFIEATDIANGLEFEGHDKRTLNNKKLMFSKISNLIKDGNLKLTSRGYYINDPKDQYLEESSLFRETLQSMTNYTLANPTNFINPDSATVINPGDSTSVAGANKLSDPSTAMYSPEEELEFDTQLGGFAEMWSKYSDYDQERMYNLLVEGVSTGVGLFPGAHLVGSAIGFGGTLNSARIDYNDPEVGAGEMGANLAMGSFLDLLSLTYFGKAGKVAKVGEAASGLLKQGAILGLKGALAAFKLRYGLDAALTSADAALNKDIVDWNVEDWQAVASTAQLFLSGANSIKKYGQTKIAGANKPKIEPGKKPTLVQKVKEKVITKARGSKQKSFEGDVKRLEQTQRLIPKKYPSRHSINKGRQTSKDLDAEVKSIDASIEVNKTGATNIEQNLTTPRKSDGSTVKERQGEGYTYKKDPEVVVNKKPKVEEPKNKPKTEEVVNKGDTKAKPKLEPKQDAPPNRKKGQSKKSHEREKKKWESKQKKGKSQEKSASKEEPKKEKTDKSTKAPKGGNKVVAKKVTQIRKDRERISRQEKNKKGSDKREEKLVARKEKVEKNLESNRKLTKLQTTIKKNKVDSGKPKTEKYTSNVEKAEKTKKKVEKEEAKIDSELETLNKKKSESLTPDERERISTLKDEKIKATEKTTQADKNVKEHKDILDKHNSGTIQKVKNKVKKVKGRVKTGAAKLVPKAVKKAGKRTAKELQEVGSTLLHTDAKAYKNIFRATLSRDRKEGKRGKRKNSKTLNKLNKVKTNRNGGRLIPKAFNGIAVTDPGDDKLSALLGMSQSIFGGSPTADEIQRFNEGISQLSPEELTQFKTAYGTLGNGDFDANYKKFTTENPGISSSIGYVAPEEEEEGDVIETVDPVTPVTPVDPVDPVTPVTPVTTGAATTTTTTTTPEKYTVGDPNLSNTHKAKWWDSAAKLDPSIFYNMYQARKPMKEFTAETKKIIPRAMSKSVVKDMPGMGQAMADAGKPAIRYSGSDLTRTKELAVQNSAYSNKAKAELISKNAQYVQQQEMANKGIDKFSNEMQFKADSANAAAFNKNQLISRNSEAGMAAKRDSNIMKADGQAMNRLTSLYSESKKQGDINKYLDMRDQTSNYNNFIAKERLGSYSSGLSTAVEGLTGDELTAATKKYNDSYDYNADGSDVTDDLLREKYYKASGYKPWETSYQEDYNRYKRKYEYDQYSRGYGRDPYGRDPYGR